jgi:hypothetical protein
MGFDSLRGGGALKDVVFFWGLVGCWVVCEEMRCCCVLRALWWGFAVLLFRCGRHWHFETGDVCAFIRFSSFAGDEREGGSIVVWRGAHCDSEFNVRGVFPGAVSGRCGGNWASKRELIGGADVRRDSGDNFEGR